MPAVVHKLDIQKNEDGDLVLAHTQDGTDQGTLNNDETLQVHPLERISWSCSIGNFAVLFNDDSPFNDSGVALGTKKKKSTSTKIFKSLGGTPEDPQVQPFKYTVIVIEDGQPPIVADPLLEIDDSGGGVE